MNRKEDNKKKRRSKRIADAKANELFRSGQRKIINDNRNLGISLKPILKKVGCDLPFYDFIDSYSDEFDRIAEEAKKNYRSITAIREVSKAEFEIPDWSRFGFPLLRQLFFLIPEECAGYERNAAHGNLRGSATFFHDPENSLRSIILLQRRIPDSANTEDLQYAIKIAGLLHEIGHVIDAENSINIRIDDRVMDVVAAEVFANVYALDALAKRSLSQSYSMLYEALEKNASLSGYIGDIGKGVLSRHGRVKIPNWNDYLDDAREYISL